MTTFDTIVEVPAGTSNGIPSRFVDLVEETRLCERIHREAEIFDEEMQRIFNRNWVYVAHEVEVPENGDFKTTTIGRQPVIVVRDHDSRELHVMYNRCRRRGVR